MIHGITIQLAVATSTSTNEFNEAIKTVEYVSVDDVLVGQPDSEGVYSSVELTGKKTAYMLAIPKGDSHEWKDTTVILPAPFAGIYKAVGEPVAGIEKNIPLRWNKKIMVEKIE